MVSINFKIKENNGIIFIYFYIFVFLKKKVILRLILKFIVIFFLKLFLFNFLWEFVFRYWKKLISLRLLMCMYLISIIIGLNWFRLWGLCFFCFVEFVIFSKFLWVILIFFLLNSFFMNIINCLFIEIF